MEHAHTGTTGRGGYPVDKFRRYADLTAIRNLVLAMSTSPATHPLLVRANPSNEC